MPIMMNPPNEINFQDSQYMEKIETAKILQELRLSGSALTVTESSNKQWQSLAQHESSQTSLKRRKCCRMDGCAEPAARRTPYCANHCGPRKCEFTGCSKCAQGRTRFCISHGGGRRCQHPNCNKGARDRQFCAAHGGGKRCKEAGCNKLAVGGFNKCTTHGGGKRCKADNCTKSAQSSTHFCVRHGGGRKCAINGCKKVARGKTLMCMSHGAILSTKTALAFDNAPQTSLFQLGQCVFLNDLGPHAYNI
mmetsp:Transcript_8235/g.12112  ORF Transcript_8235/g.12112 Transcript_8235/m.12112 type:complete len:250 (-) Transcript_8235:243-992(-)